MNNVFEFKQFSIEQTSSVFKVGTDACLLGAWVEVSNAALILDVGTGTGVIALICAQRNKTAQILAIDINSEATDLAAKNFLNSPWKSRLKTQCVRFQDLQLSELFHFDLIVCNPPFFKDSIHNSTQSQSLARHEIALNLAEMLEKAVNVLSPDGNIALIIPYARASELLQISSQVGLHIQRLFSVAPFGHKPANRLMVSLAKNKVDYHESHLVLRSSAKSYSAEFQQLMQPYYKNF